jgi:hypothetical protein
MIDKTAAGEIMSATQNLLEQPTNVSHARSGILSFCGPAHDGTVCVKILDKK